jgi:peptidoglycan hydrolase CwlO-like protein
MPIVPFPHSIRSRLQLLGALAVTVFVLSGSFPGGAGLKEEIDELKREQEQVQKNKEDKAKEVDVATAEAAEVAAALEVLNTEVNEQATKVAAAERALVAAQNEHDVAVTAVLEQTVAIGDLENRLSERAISSFVTQGPPQAPMLQETDPNVAVRMQSLVQVVTDDGISLTDQLRAAKEDLELEQQAAADAAEEAETIRVQLAEDLAELERRQAAQTDLVAEAEARLERSLAEAWALSELDNELSSEIDRKNDELAAQLAAAARRNNPAPSTTSVGFPSASDIVGVRGFWVHRDIAGSLEALLAHAESDGIVLRGGGYRDSQSQIRLRRAHCGTSNYAVYQMPASQCRPPTARPGASMHEQGKAIDFTYNGSIIGTRSSAAFQWLAANAGAYGFYNLPSEPWHWSVNGR